MFIESIQIEDLRCFRHTAVSFRHPELASPGSAALPNVTLLLGNNGAGKSSVLRAVSLAALAAVVQSSGYVPFSMVRRSSTGTASSAFIRGRFKLHAQDGDGVKAPTEAPVETQVRILRRGTTEQISAPDAEQSSWERIYDDTSPAFLMLGYGATRRVEGSDSVDISARRKARLLRYQRVAGLFEEHITMVPLNAWLPEWETRNPGRHKQVINLLDRLLPEGMRFRAEREQGQYLFEHRGVKISFGAMSDGYRQYVGWISDLLYHVCMGCPSGKKLEENRGIVLIDEIDLHLHPEWQRTVIPTMSATLPNLQFILTSHSPIVVGTLHRENVIVFNQDSEGASIAERVEIEVHGLNADQVLTSRAFGLTSSRAPEFVEQLKQTSAQAQRGDEEAQRRFHKMIVYGAAADSVQSKVEAAPPEVIEAARRLSAIHGAADSRPRARRPAKKKAAATKKSARKKKRSARKKR